MKKITLSLALLSTFALANSKVDIYKELENLKKQNELQAKIIKQLQERLDDMDEDIERVETSTLVDKVKLNLDFDVKNNNYSKKYADGHKVSSNNLSSTKLSLGLKANIAKNMKFHGKLSMYKYWADSTKHFYSQFDSMQGRVPSDSSLYVERAYVDWYFDAGVPSALTIGRQPSADGPSHQFSANRKRQSTYSALVFDGASDGIVWTSNLQKALGVKGARLRFAYGKGFQNDETSSYVQNAFIGSSDTTLKDTDVLGAFYESNIAGVDNTLFQIGYVKMGDIVANAMDNNTSANKNIGDVEFAGVMFEGTNIYHSNLDLFAHYGISRAKPSKELYTCPSGKTGGLLRDDADDLSTKNGHAFWIGGRYTFKNLKNFRLGVEYNQGSQYWVSATQGSYDLTNKLATRGKAYEMYGIYPINRSSFIKFGAVKIDYDYTNSGWFLSKPIKISDLTANKDKVLDSLTNFYLQFSVNY